MESRLPNARRPIRTHRNVFRTHELARYLPNDDEHYLPYRGRPGMAIRIHGRHRHPHQTRRRRNRTTTSGTSPVIHPPYASQTRTKRLISKTRKMRLRAEGDRLPRCHSRQRPNTDGPQKAQRRRRLARPPQPNGNPKIPWIHGLLSLLRPRLLENSTPLTRPYKKGCRLALGRTTTQSIRRAQNTNVLPPHPHTTRLQQTLLPSNRCIGLWRGRHTLAGG